MTTAALRKPVVIVGGGLAGLAAAVRLAEAGDRPLIIETRKRLGGRATSFVDPRSGLVLDNCQHVLLGCCTNLIDLYERIGVSDLIEWHDRQYWTEGRGEIDVIEPGRLPAPLHMSRSFMRARLFGGSSKRMIARAMWRLIRLGAAGRLRWRGKTFRAFLESCGQSDDVIDRFWNTVVVSACNLDVARVDAACAMQVFQEGFLAGRWSVTIGLPTVPLLDLYDPAREFIEAAGGEVRTGVSAKAIAYDGAKATGVVTDDGLVPASWVVSAVPFDRLDKLTSAALKRADRRLQKLDALTTSPILAVHLVFDQHVLDEPHLVLVGHGVQWIFNKGIDELGGHHLHAVISAADEWMPLEEDEIIRRVLDDVHAVIPKARGLEPVDARAVKEKRATFAAVAGVDDARPSVEPGFVGSGGGGVPNLLITGDWVDTGWPATMEGAVRSGYAAAHAITEAGGVVADVPPGRLAALLGLK